VKARLNRQQALQQRSGSDCDVPSGRAGDDIELPRRRLAIARLENADWSPAYEPVRTQPERQNQNDGSSQKSDEKLGVPTHVDAQTDIEAWV
jgi:hypothetical protein